ncbi:hypothetical protein DVK85_00810 [Flavobacterium arcticum]|uniref:Helix-hairpin-helix domain-containing protein n=1 Tax=Flavobacterium arcticum TaxID=1784713 RepID=A0A345H8D7_9FLAO|nr:helix-hairpin-helix domain-containing protein [Flavobacterium arcticum]AXG72847.1 hypothetical protein DVK85_00810 [Flavobacterium arcticum]KAF2510488.1 hypothetical protein E0W72_08395 [Flavobacterium arcticum]
MQPFRFFFHYTKGQRKGIVALLLLIIVVQATYFVTTSRNWQSEARQSEEQKEWLALQTQIDTLKARKAKAAYKIYPFNPNYITDYKGYTLGMSNAEIDRLHKFRETKKYVNSAEEFQEVTKVSDSLLEKIAPYFKFPSWVKNKKGKRGAKIYPFNPNYISDYKAKLIGLSKQELARIRKFRKTNKYINSAKDFQEVTKISDSRLKKIEPYFKFPDWVTERQNKTVEIYPFNPNYISDFKAQLIGLSSKELKRIRDFRAKNKYVNSAEEFQEVTKVSDSLLKAISPYFKFPDWVNKKNNAAVIDINKATADQLIAIYGIGPVYSKRILERREQLGAYVSMEQMDDFDFRDYTPNTNEELKKRFTVVGKPRVKTININTASLNELSSFPYFNETIASNIIAKRKVQGRIGNIEELTKINGFPVEKEKIIALYLKF